MTIYAPGTEETDQKKQNMSLQAIAGAATTAITNIATNTANIATNTADIATITTNIAILATIAASPIRNSLGADVALNNTANYFTGPTIAQGTTGTWVVTGTVTVTDTAGAGLFFAKLWDGTTVIDSCSQNTTAANFVAPLTLSGIITSPAGNLRIDVRDTLNTTGKILFNNSGNSKDSTITAFRIA